MCLPVEFRDNIKRFSVNIQANAGMIHLWSESICCYATDQAMTHRASFFFCQNYFQEKWTLHNIKEHLSFLTRSSVMRFHTQIEASTNHVALNQSHVTTYGNSRPVDCLHLCSLSPRTGSWDKPGEYKVSYATYLQSSLIIFFVSSPLCIIKDL